MFVEHYVRFKLAVAVIGWAFHQTTRVHPQVTLPHQTFAETGIALVASIGLDAPVDIHVVIQPLLAHVNLVAYFAGDGGLSLFLGQMVDSAG